MDWLQTISYVAGIVVGIAAIATPIWQIMKRTKRQKDTEIRVSKDISEKDFSEGVKSLKDKIKDKFVPDLIIAISSGGATVGGILSKHLNIPLAIITRSNPQLQERIPRESKIIFLPSSQFIKDKKILLVDDIIRGGWTFETASGEILKESPSEIKLAVLMYAGEHQKPDFYVYKAIRPGLRMFYDYEKIQLR